MGHIRDKSLEYKVRSGYKVNFIRTNKEVYRPSTNGLDLGILNPFFLKPFVLKITVNIHGNLRPASPPISGHVAYFCINVPSWSKSQ